MKRASLALHQRSALLQRLRRTIAPAPDDPTGDLRPVSEVFGFDRGQPIDRFYIEEFLRAHASDIRGQVLEVGDDRYTREFGGSRVSQSDVLHATAGNKRATIVGNLETGEGLPSDRFDCILLTQTLQMLFDLRSAVAVTRRLLRPAGVVLVTVPGISQVSRYDMARWGDYWRFTDASIRRLFEAEYGSAITVGTFGNPASAAGVLYGLAVEDIDQEALVASDPDYQVIVAIRAQKPIGEPGAP